MATTTFNLNLAKPEINSFDELLSDGGTDALTHVNSMTFDGLDIGEGGKLYIMAGNSHSPPWLRRLEANFDLNINKVTLSVCGILAFRTSGRIFASIFSYGWMYLNDRSMVRDFGLRVAINALDNLKLKKLERTNLADALRDSALSPFQRDFTSFGIDDALELVRSLSGTALDGVNASNISGSTSLKWSSERELLELPEMAVEAIELFESEAYKDTPFGVIDILRPIVDLDLIDRLDEETVNHIRQETGNFELGMPTPVGDDDVTYWFQGIGGRRSYEDLLLGSYALILGDELENLSVDQIKDQRIIAKSLSEQSKSTTCTIHTALVGSMDFEGVLYALNDGLWYEVERGFKESIEQMFLEVVADWEVEPLPFARVANPRGKGLHYEAESIYNEKVAQQFEIFNLDRKLISNPNFERSRFEVCDLLDLENKRLIHVKKNSRKSPILSHLFKQGSHSAQQLKYFESCKQELRQMLNDEFGNAAGIAFDDAEASDENWTVEFWIADSPRRNGQFNIPFFSKISLRDEIRRLRGLEYNVSIKFIRLTVPVK